MAAKQVNALNIQNAGIPVFDGTATFTETTVTQYNVQTGGASNALNSVAPSATSGVPLVSNGSSSQPSFTTAVVAGGGTGITSTTAYAPICAGTSTTGAFQAATTGLSTSGYILTSTGSSSLPSFQSLSGANLVLIQTQSATSSASISFTTGITSTYSTYIFCLSNIFPATNAAYLSLAISTNGGVSYIATGYFSGINRNAYNTATLTNSNATTFMYISGATDSTTSDTPICGWLYLFNITNGGLPSMLGYTLGYNTADTAVDSYNILATNTGNTDVDAFQFTMSSGNIASGTFTLFGVLE